MKSKQLIRWNNLTKIGAALVALALFFWADSSYAAVSGIALSSITQHVNSTVGQLARILTDIALITGVGFVLASFFKFHQHKLNPTQVPISQGVTLLLIGAALLVFVMMLPTAKRAVFGNASMATVGGSQMESVIGASATTSGGGNKP